MKRTIFGLLSALSVWSLNAVEVDIFKDASDPRVTVFTVPAADKAPPVKRFVITSADGKKYYPQALLISRYPSGSPRWYRLVADVPAGKYQVADGEISGKPWTNPVKYDKEKRNFTNSKVSFSYQEKPFAVIVKYQGREYRITPPEITLPDGSKPQAEFKSVKPFDLGRVQSGLEFSGVFTPSPAGEERYWRLRITMWVNKGFIGIEPLLGVKLDKVAKTTFDEMRAWKSAKMQITLPAGKLPAQSLIQWEDSAYEKSVNGKSETVKGALGVFDLAGSGHVVIPEMAERFPIGVSSKDNTFTVDLLPEILPVDRYSKREKDYIQYFALRTGNYVMCAGVEVSYPMYLVLDKKIDAAKLLAPFPVGMVNVDDLNKSGAWLNHIAGTDKYSAPFDKEIKIGLDAYFKWQKKERWYGFLNYGDCHGERLWNWFNHEYDTAAVFFEQALRLRNPDYFREAVRSARHQMEVDTVKNHPGDRNGAVYTHAVGHTGGYYRVGELPAGRYGGNEPFLSGRFTNGHTRIRGMCMAFVLTGDRRFRDTAQSTGDWIRKSEMFLYRRWRATHREPGWALVNLTSLYWMNAGKRFLFAAEELGWVVMSHAKGRGVAMIWLHPHNCPKPPEGWNKENSVYRTGGLSFPTGYQAAGMYLLMQATEDEYLKKAIKENLKATADYVKARLYVKSARGFVHSPVPWRRQSIRNGGGAGSSLRNVLLMDAYLNGDKESLAIAKDTMQQMLTRREVFASPLKQSNPDDPGPKSVSSGLYFIPLTLDFMKKMDIVMPEIKYDTSKRVIWSGTQRGVHKQKKNKK